MLRKDVRDIIDWHLSEYGQGYGYEIYLNDRRIWRTSTLKKQAQEGDVVVVEVYRGHGKYSGGYVIDAITFTIENDRDAIERQRKYRESRRKMRATYKRPTDYQRQKLYNWERKHVEGFRDPKLEWDEAVQFVNGMFDKLGLKPPKMKLHKGRKRRCAYFPSFHEIRMGPWGLTKPILVHESAHAVVKLAGINGKVAGHGPAFVRAYIDLLGRFLHLHTDMLTQSAKDYGLDVAEDFDFQSLAALVQEGETVPDEVLASLQKGTKNTDELNSNQRMTLAAINADAQRSVDGRSARALQNRGFVFKTPDGEWKVTEAGRNWING